MGPMPNPFPALIVICVVIGFLMGVCAYKGCEFVSKYKINIEKKVKEVKDDSNSREK